MHSSWIPTWDGESWVTQGTAGFFDNPNRVEESPRLESKWDQEEYDENMLAEVERRLESLEHLGQYQQVHHPYGRHTSTYHQFRGTCFGCGVRGHRERDCGHHWRYQRSAPALGIHLPLMDGEGAASHFGHGQGNGPAPSQQGIGMGRIQKIPRQGILHLSLPSEMFQEIVNFQTQHLNQSLYQHALFHATFLLIQQQYTRQLQ